VAAIRCKSRTPRGTTLGLLERPLSFRDQTYTNIPDPANKAPLTTTAAEIRWPFYNVQPGDAPVLKSLADEFSMSDNFHQSFMGGTGANHVMLGTGDAISGLTGNGNPTTPPSHIRQSRSATGTNNVYTVDLNFDGKLHRVRQSLAARRQAHPGLSEISPYDADPNCNGDIFI